jgi:drug/metabolite transporter (DMT)-like permease
MLRVMSRSNVATGDRRLERGTTRWYRLSGMALVVTSAASFGSLPLFARAAYAAGSDPQTVLLVRFVLAGAILCAAMVIRGAALPRGRTLLGLILLGAIGNVGQALSYYTALTLASVSLVALLLYLYPALVHALSALVLRERLHRYQVVALGMALGGAVLTAGRVGDGRPLGIILALISALIYSGYIVASSRLTARVPVLPATTTVTVTAGAVFAALSLVHHPALPATATGWAAMVAIAVLGSLVGLMTFFWGLPRVGPSTAATLSTVEPAVAVGLAVWALGERLTAGQVFGAALILAALLVLARHQGRSPVRQD